VTDSPSVLVRRPNHSTTAYGRLPDKTKPELISIYYISLIAFLYMQRI